jgi:hypothetical protein
MPASPEGSSGRATYPVSADLFRQVYDSPRSLPGKHVWVTPDADVREIERLLGIEEHAIGAPLWLSGDERACPKCGRETSWLDIVASALGDVHGKQMIAQVVLGEQKFVNVEAPRAIAGLRCRECGTAIESLRSFKCHNWAYAVGDLARIVERLAGGG